MDFEEYFPVWEGGEKEEVVEKTTEYHEKAIKLNPQLYEWLEVKEIDEIQRHFAELTSDGLSYEEFRKLLLRFKLQYDDDVFDILCLKIDMDRDKRIKFHEFISYFIAEYQHDDNAADKFSIVPPIRKLPKVLKSPARNRIAKVFYIPPLHATNKSNLDSSYITFSCYGAAYFWSLKWKLNRVMHFGKLYRFTLPTTPRFQFTLKFCRHND
jgi:hypothetical protein